MANYKHCEECGKFHEIIMKREKGYYWIMVSDTWEIAEYGDFGNWWLPGVSNSLCDELINQIDERKIERN